MVEATTSHRVLIITDIHYACAAEKRRGDYESRTVSKPLPRWLLKQYRHFLWRRDVYGGNHFVDRFIHRASKADWVLGNGDYCCDSAFIGVADDPCLESAQECLGKLRSAFGENFVGIMGDHDLGKKSMFGGVGGMRLKSWTRCVETLQLKPLYTLEVGRYVLVGMNSSLIALPSCIGDCPAEEVDQWMALRQDHLEALRQTLEQVPKDRRLLFFLHDPSALPHLAEQPWMPAFWSRLDGTYIGHLHSELILKMSGVLAGMPRLTGLGHTALKISTALQKAEKWRPFKVQLIPAPGGIEIWKKGGYGELLIPAGEQGRPTLKIHPLDQAD